MDSYRSNNSTFYTGVKPKIGIIHEGQEQTLMDKEHIEESAEGFYTLFFSSIFKVTDFQRSLSIKTNPRSWTPKPWTTHYFTHWGEGKVSWCFSGNRWEGGLLVESVACKFSLRKGCCVQPSVGQSPVVSAIEARPGRCHNARSSRHVRPLSRCDLRVSWFRPVEGGEETFVNLVPWW